MGDIEREVDSVITMSGNTWQPVIPRAVERGVKDNVRLSWIVFGNFFFHFIQIF